MADPARTSVGKGQRALAHSGMSGRCGLTYSPEPSRARLRLSMPYSVGDTRGLARAGSPCRGVKGLCFDALQHPLAARASPSLGWGHGGGTKGARATLSQGGTCNVQSSFACPLAVGSSRRGLRCPTDSGCVVCGAGRQQRDHQDRPGFRSTIFRTTSRTRAATSRWTSTTMTWVPTSSPR